MVAIVSTVIAVASGRLGSSITVSQTPTPTAVTLTPTANSNPNPVVPFQPTWPATGAWTIVYCLVGLLLLLVLLLLLLFLLRRRNKEAVAVSTAPQPTTLLDQPKKALMDQRLSRLEQLQTWMGEDPELERFIDDTIGKHVRAVERRQRFLSVTFSVVGIVAGWLLSGFSTSAVLLRLIPH
jgi:LPXTG-motif cell wall-anchored protein